MPGTAINLIYELECNHAVVSSAMLVSGQLYCPFHAATINITGIHIWEWRAACSMCKFSRWAGLVKTNADTFANGHMRRNIGHSAFIEYTKNPDAERMQEKMDSFNGRAIRRT